MLDVILNMLFSNILPHIQFKLQLLHYNTKVKKIDPN